jgi:hypothetical protein
MRFGDWLEKLRREEIIGQDGGFGQPARRAMMLLPAHRNEEDGCQLVEELYRECALSTRSCAKPLVLAKTPAHSAERLRDDAMGGASGESDA